MRNTRKILLILSNLLERVTTFIIQLSVASILVALLLSVLFRYVLETSFVGTNEIALYLLAWITFLGASLSIKKGSMVAVNFLVERSGKYYKIVQTIIQLLILLFSLILFIYGINWMLAPSNLNTVSSELQIPVWIPFSVVPISMLITIVFNIENIINLFSKSNSTNDHGTELL